MILWTPYFRNNSSRTHQPLTNNGMRALRRIVLATINDGQKRNEEVEDHSIETHRRTCQTSRSLICDIALIRAGRRVLVTARYSRRCDLLIFFEADPAKTIN